MPLRKHSPGRCWQTRPMAMPLWRQSPQVGAAVGSCTEVNVLRIGALAEVTGQKPGRTHGILVGYNQQH